MMHNNKWYYWGSETKPKDFEEFESSACYMLAQEESQREGGYKGPKERKKRHTQFGSHGK